MKRLMKILSLTQEELLEYTEKVLSLNGYEDILACDEFVFGLGEIPIMLVAHLDTVHKDLPEIFYDRKKGVLWSPQGIGGDDRCGVYAICQLIERYKPYVLFTTDEETGALGADKFTSLMPKELLNEVKFIIEIDRRGRNQAVFYDCGNKEFQNYILSFGLDKQYGSFSDICTISPKFDIASVNFSAGYYSEHTKQEYIVVADLCHTIAVVERILNDHENVGKFDYQEVEYTPPLYNNLYGNYDWFGEKSSYKSKSSYRTDDEDMLFDFEELTEEEWLEIYGYEKPKTYNELYRKMWNI